MADQEGGIVKQREWNRAEPMRVLARCPCGKVGHETKADARKARDRLSSGGAIKGKMRTYQCPQSGLWHLTSQSKVEYVKTATNANTKKRGIKT